MDEKAETEQLPVGYAQSLAALIQGVLCREGGGTLGFRLDSAADLLDVARGAYAARGLEDS